MTNKKNPIQARPTPRKKGFTLTEIAIVLGIIGLILGAIWVAAASVYQNQRIGHASTAMLHTVQGVRSLYATSSNVGTAGDITQNMIQAGLLPSDIVIPGATSAPWTAGPFAGGTMSVLTKTAADTSFTVEMTMVPEPACIALITQLAGTSRDPGLTAVGASVAQTSPITIAAAAAGTALNPSTTGITAAVTPVEAAAACTSASGTGPLQLEFTIK